jgi:hypothetical protein
MNLTEWYRMLSKWKMFLSLFAVSFAFAQEPADSVALRPEAAENVQPAAVPETSQTAPGAEASDGQGTTVSVFVKSPEEIRALREEL